MRTNEQLAQQVGESREQIRRFIRLTNLTPELLDLVDNSVLKEKDKLQIALRPAVELFYLRKEEQADLFQIIQEMDCTSSHAQAIKMRAIRGEKRRRTACKRRICLDYEEKKGSQKE